MLLRIPRLPSTPLSWSQLTSSLPRSFSSTSLSRSSTPTPSSSSTPRRVCIVGGGPAGFYAASRLLSLPGSESAKVDLYELLPTPFGLARFGVAPDHPEVKNCEHKFEETAQDPRFRYFGNVQISGDTTPPPHSSSSSSSSSSSTIVPNLSPSSLAIQIPLSTLRNHYDSVLLTYGASLDRPLSIPGEFELSNVLSARTFVNWYNGHPYHSSLLSPLLDLSKINHVSIIGQGNVALDVARMLLKPVEELEEFDLPDYALAELARSRVKTVEIVGRRGLVQFAGTTKEVREMLQLKGVGFEGIEREMLSQSQGEVEGMTQEQGGRAKKRMMGLLEKGSKTKLGQADKSWSLKFLRSPTRLLPSDPTQAQVEGQETTFESILSAPQKVGAIEYDLNRLVPGKNSEDPNDFIAEATGETKRVETDMVFKSVGYRSIGLPGLPFDERKGVVRNIDGRVTDDKGSILEGLYTSGWLSRGPTGVIATTMFNAFSTADLIASDLSTSSAASRSSEGDIESMIERYREGKKVVSWKEWERIDRVERERGREKGKLREKITSVDKMLRVIE